MKKLFTLLFAAVMAMSLSFATFAEDKPAAEKPASTSTKKSKKTSAEKKAAADQKKADEAAKAKK
jgi:type IV secretory pathway VirB6-like protein